MPAIICGQHVCCQAMPEKQTPLGHEVDIKIVNIMKRKILFLLSKKQSIYLGNVEVPWYTFN